MASKGMELYELAQEDFHVLEEKFTENPTLLKNEDSVSCFGFDGIFR